MRMFPASIRGREAGFTLLEMLVVLAILSNQLAAVPTLYSKIIPSYQLRQFANDVANAGRTLRDKARLDGGTKKISIVTSLNLVSAEEVSIDMPADVVVVFEPATAYSDAPSDVIYFYANGATSGGKLRLSKGNLEVSVDFDWMSGAVSVQQ